MGRPGVGALRPEPVGPTLTVRPLEPGDWPAVSAIYAEGIATGDATFETELPTWEAWDGARRPEGRLVAVDPGGIVVGWAALSPVSSRPAYAGVAEVGVYVAAVCRGRGVGRRLLDALVAASEGAGIWTLQSSVFPENEATLRLHAGAGFREVGRRERIGRHRGRWRDTILLERRSPVVG